MAEVEATIRNAQSDLDGAKARLAKEASPYHKSVLQQRIDEAIAALRAARERKATLRQSNLDPQAKLAEVNRKSLALKREQTVRRDEFARRQTIWPQRNNTSATQRISTLTTGLRSRKLGCSWSISHNNTCQRLQGNSFRRCTKGWWPKCKKSREMIQTLTNLLRLPKWHQPWRPSHEWSARSKRLWRKWQ